MGGGGGDYTAIQLMGVCRNVLKCQPPPTSQKLQVLTCCSSNLLMNMLLTAALNVFAVPLLCIPANTVTSTNLGPVQSKTASTSKGKAAAGSKAAAGGQKMTSTDAAAEADGDDATAAAAALTELSIGQKRATPASARPQRKAAAAAMALQQKIQELDDGASLGDGDSDSGDDVRLCSPEEKKQARGSKGASSGSSKGSGGSHLPSCCWCGPCA